MFELRLFQPSASSSREQEEAARRPANHETSSQKAMIFRDFQDLLLKEHLKRDTTRLNGLDVKSSQVKSSEEMENFPCNRELELHTPPLIGGVFDNVNALLLVSIFPSLTTF